MGGGARGRRKIKCGKIWNKSDTRGFAIGRLSFPRPALTLHHTSHQLQLPLPLTLFVHPAPLTLFTCRRVIASALRANKSCSCLRALLPHSHSHSYSPSLSHFCHHSIHLQACDCLSFSCQQILQLLACLTACLCLALGSCCVCTLKCDCGLLGQSVRWAEKKISVRGCMVRENV